MNIALVSLLIFSYLISVGNGVLGLGLAGLVIIFFNIIYNFFSKKNILDLTKIVIVVGIGILVFIASYFHNKTFDNYFGTGKITDNLGSGHYKLESLEQNKKIYITSKKNLQIGDIISLNKSYRQHGQDCQQCLVRNNLVFGMPSSSFEKYLFVNGYDGSSFENYPKVIGNEKNFFEATRENISQKIENNFQNPWLLKGLLLGDKASLTSQQKTEFKNAGLLHLMVASGGNIALVSSLVAILFFFLPFYARVVLSCIVAIIYCLMIGFDIPIARALVMSLFSTLAILSGRVTKPMQGLGIAFLFFGLLNPYSIRYDLSFQLSFLAVLGIIICNQLNFFKNKILKNLFSMILTPLGASIFTFGVIISLGNYNLLSIFTNILASGLVAILSYLGIIGIFLPSLSPIVNYFSNLLIGLAKISSEKGIYITLDQNHYIEFLILWLIILASIYFLSIGNKKSA